MLNNALVNLAGGIAELVGQGSMCLSGFGVHSGVVESGSDALEVVAYLQRFPPNRLEEAIRDLHERTESLVAEHWPAIKALADALLEREELTGDEVALVLAD